MKRVCALAHTYSEPEDKTNHHSDLNVTIQSKPVLLAIPITPVESSPLFYSYSNNRLFSGGRTRNTVRQCGDKLNAVLLNREHSVCLSVCLLSASGLGLHQTE